MREWCKYKENSDWYYDRPIARSKFGEILEKLINKSEWQKSDYQKLSHPFYEKVKNKKGKYDILESYYFDTEDLKLLLDYLENDLEIKLQRFISNPPRLEKDHPLYGESIAPFTIKFRDKTLTSDTFFLQINEELRETWSLSNTVNSLQDEVNKSGGLYLVYAELIENTTI